MSNASKLLSLTGASNSDVFVGLGQGTYSAVMIGSIVKVSADQVQMSGISAHADLVRIPTVAPPVKYKLLVTEVHPQLANLIYGSATASFQGDGPDGAAGKVQIEDKSGVQDVPIKVL